MVIKYENESSGFCCVPPSKTQGTSMLNYCRWNLALLPLMCHGIPLEDSSQRQVMLWALLTMCFLGELLCDRDHWNGLMAILRWGLLVHKSFSYGGSGGSCERRIFLLIRTKTENGGIRKDFHDFQVKGKIGSSLNEVYWDYWGNG